MTEYRILHGNPDDTELAVVVSLLVAAHQARPAAAAEPPSNWALPVMRHDHPAGPGHWWRSGLPQP